MYLLDYLYALSAQFYYIAQGQGGGPSSIQCNTEDLQALYLMLGNISNTLAFIYPTTWAIVIAKKILS